MIRFSLVLSSKIESKASIFVDCFMLFYNLKFVATESQASIYTMLPNFRPLFYSQDTIMKWECKECSRDKNCGEVEDNEHFGRLVVA